VANPDFSSPEANQRFPDGIPKQARLRTAHRRTTRRFAANISRYNVGSL
jgi:hypothetical protein